MGRVIGRLLMTVCCISPDQAPLQRHDIVGSDGSLSPAVMIRLPPPYLTHAVVFGWIRPPRKER